MKLHHGRRKRHLTLVTTLLAGLLFLVGCGTAPRIASVITDGYNLEQINYVFEKSASGKSNKWVNPDTFSQCVMTPKPAFTRQEDKTPCRKAEFIMRPINGSGVKVLLTGCRDKYGQWEIQEDSISLSLLDPAGTVIQHRSSADKSLAHQPNPTETQQKSNGTNPKQYATMRTRTKGGNPFSQNNKLRKSTPDTEEVVNVNAQKPLLTFNGLKIRPNEVLSFDQWFFEELGNTNYYLAPSKFFDASNSITDKYAKDLLFVYGLMALALDDRQEEAFEKLEQYQPALSGFDDLPTIEPDALEPDVVLQFAYRWLINHTSITVPCWFVQQYPDLFYTGTPIWAASRDSQFSVCTPESWNIRLLTAYRKLLDAIDDADNPGHCYSGSISFSGMTIKKAAINEAVLANRPDVYWQNVPRDDTSKWLYYWQYLDPYNHKVFEQIQNIVKQVNPELANMLVKTGKVNKEQAELAADRYLNNLLASRLGGWGQSKVLDTALDEYNKFGIETIKDLNDKNLIIFGGYLLYNKPVEELLRYVFWLKNHDKLFAVYSLMNMAAANNTFVLQKILSLNFEFPEKWGHFNKSPLLYAVQYNNGDSYNLLKKISSMDTVTFSDTSSRDYIDNNCSIPDIGKRNVLTYAAQYTDEILLTQVMNDFGFKYACKKDTEGRGIDQYLILNKKISRSYKEKLANQLNLYNCTDTTLSNKQLFLKKSILLNENIFALEDQTNIETIENYAKLYENSENYIKAIPLYEKILTIQEKTLGLENHDILGIINKLGLLYKRIENYEKSIDFYERCLKIATKTLGPKNHNTVIIMNNLAMVYDALGNYEKAQSLYEQALTIQENKHSYDYNLTANIIDNLAIIYRSLGKYEKSTIFFEKSLKIYKKILGPEHLYTATTLGRLANAYSYLGNYEKTKTLYEQALTIIRKIFEPESTAVANSLNNLGTAYLAIGNYGKAKMLYERALKILKKKSWSKDILLAACLNNLGMLYQSLGNNKKARLFYERAAAIEKASKPNEGGGAILRDNIAFLDILDGRIDQAMKHFYKTDRHGGLGCCYLARREFIAAKEEFKNSLFVFRDKEGYKEIPIANFIGLGCANEGLNEMDEAVDAFQMAVDRIETQYQTLSPAARRSFLGGNTAFNFKRLDAYEGLIRTLIKQKKNGYAARALQVAERVKSRTLLEQLAARGAAGANREDAATLKKDRQFQQKLTMLYKQIEVLDKLAREGKTVDRGRRKAVDAELQEVQQQYEQFINEVKMNNRELASLISVQTVDVDEIQQLLDPDTTIVEYFTGAKNSYIWTITKNDIQVKQLDLDNKHIAGLVNDYRLSLHPPGVSRSTGQKPVLVIAEDFLNRGIAGVGPMEPQRNKAALSDELYREIIQPVEDRLRTGKLIIVPHGSLHKLPFSALGHDGRFLMDHYTISTAPSASVLSYVTKKRNPNHHKLLAFANPETMYPSLPATETEVAHISPLFSGRAEVYKRAGATETRARLQSNTPDVIHFASHGEFNERQPMQSGLLLSKDGQNDGRLQVHELFGLNLKNANLVTLSACQTALAKIESGDDMIGLSRGFIYAGTPALLASLWDVEDNATATLMEEFYTNWLQKKMTRPEALRQAQLTVKNNPRTSDPFYWAAFEMIGDWM